MLLGAGWANAGKNAEGGSDAIVERSLVNACWEKYCRPVPLASCMCTQLPVLSQNPKRDGCKSTRQIQSTSSRVALKPQNACMQRILQRLRLLAPQHCCHIMRDGGALPGVRLGTLRDGRASQTRTEPL